MIEPKTRKNTLDQA